MAERVMPRDAITKITTIPNKTDSLKLVYNDATDTNDSISVEDDIAEYQAGAGLNTTYRTRTKIKVLWTGPLSVITTPTSLDGGEKFSDWDRIEVHFNMFSDTSNSGRVPMTVSSIGLTDVYCYSDLGRLVFLKIDDSTFELAQKTIALGNIQRIIGISL